MTAGRQRVVGLGNELRGDDAVGLSVARALRRLEPAADVMESSGEPAGLLEALRGVDEVVLVDAVSSGARPGVIHRFDASAAALPLVHGASTHDLGLSDAIELGRALGLLPERLVVLGIEGRTFELGAPLSPEVARAADEVVAELRRLVVRRTRRDDEADGTRAG